jgi:pilus assembly protein CpaB
MVFRLGIFITFIVAVLVVCLIAYQTLNQTKPQAAAPQTTNVLVASVPLTGGELLHPTDIIAAPVPTANVPPDASIDTAANRANLIGSMARASIPAGAPILNSEVIHPGDHGFLAAVLAPGMRAVTIAVDNVTDANGLIWPGDFVDVLLTQNFGEAGSSKSIVSEDVLDNVRVIATGQELIKTAQTGPATPPDQTVTLEVTPDEASRVLVATNLGKLSLIVHSAQKSASDTAVTTQPVFSGDVSPVMNKTGASPVISTVHVFEGSPSGQDYNF